MKEFASKLESALMSLSVKLGQSTLLSSISGGFMMMLPITLLGSFASLFKGLEIEAYQAFIQSCGLYNLLGAVYQFTVGFLAVYVAFCVAYTFARKLQLDGATAITVGLTSVLVFFVVTPYTPAESIYGSATLSTAWLGSSGMFTALIISFITGKVYEICKKHHLEIKLPEQVPPTISKQFSALIPALLMAIIAMVINGLFTMTPYGNIQDAVYAIIKTPLSYVSASIWGEYILVLFLYMLWIFGIHGGMTAMPFMMILFTAAQQENLFAYQAGLDLPHMVSGSYVSIGSGSLPLVVACLLFSKAQQNKSISKIAAVPALFGVDEPAYFGIPMILNPMFFVPWVIISPTVCVWGTYLLQNLGLLGYYRGVSAGSFVPFFVGNLAGYGVSGLIWGCVFFVIVTLSYVPFLKAYDKQCLAEEEKTLQGKE